LTVILTGELSDKNLLRWHTVDCKRHTVWPEVELGSPRLRLKLSKVIFKNSAPASQRAESVPVNFRKPI
jgi:hypothetical protein